MSRIFCILNPMILLSLFKLNIFLNDEKENAYRLPQKDLIPFLLIWENCILVS